MFLRTFKKLSDAETILKQVQHRVQHRSKKFQKGFGGNLLQKVSPKT